MDVRRTDPDHPNLRVGYTLAQLTACLQFIGIRRELAGFDVDGCEFAIVPRLELRAAFLLVEGVATACELFLAVAALRIGHVGPPGTGRGARRFADGCCTRRAAGPSGTAQAGPFRKR